MSLKYSVIRPPQVMLAQFKMNLQGLSRFRSQSSLCFDVLQPHRSVQMHVLFFRKDGSEQMSRQYTSPGRWYYDQDYADTDHVYTEGDVIKFHMGHSVWREYTVVASDGDGRPFNHSEFGPFYLQGAHGQCFMCRMKAREEAKATEEALQNARST